MPFLRALDTESVDLVVIDPPFGKNQTFAGNLKPPLTEDEKRVEREMMGDWGVVDVDTAYDAGLDYPDQTGTTAKFEDIWDFRIRVYKDWLESLEAICPAAWWLIQSTRYTHGDGTAAYIAFMVERMLEIRRLLKPTGSVYIHCDSEANAYLRQMMDAVFGSNRFVNEIVWKRTSSHGTAKRWGPIHETMLFYSKSKQYKWNRTYQKYSKEYVDKHYTKEDEAGRYQLFDLTGAGIRRGASGKEWRGIDPTDTNRHWAVPGQALEGAYPGRGFDGLTTQELLDLLDEAGFVHWPKSGKMPSSPSED